MLSIPTYLHMHTLGSGYYSELHSTGWNISKCPSLSEPLAARPALSCAYNVSLVNGPEKRWHEVNHLLPPVDSKWCLVMMPGKLHHSGQMSLFLTLFSRINYDAVAGTWRRIRSRAIAEKCGLERGGEGRGGHSRYTGLLLLRHIDWFTVSGDCQYLDLAVCQD